MTRRLVAAIIVLAISAVVVSSVLAQVRTPSRPFSVLMVAWTRTLDFELRAFIPNISNVFRVSSDLRFAIDEAFREAGIEIPFPQTDVHLRDIDRLERALSGAPAGKD